ncbi:ParB/Srx family N-terminal domain-containing protein [Pelosinus sp. sgz500959]|uniref:ParB/Srx family N-terminal domain-containing protein n=1 Tax=Pelosinus sp. sgz500959 TaxID=3242472 RepID=UPI00366C0B59
MDIIHASGVPVHCSYSEIADITTLTPNPRNPNQHPEKQIELLVKIIKHQGWRLPITVSNQSGFIVRGYGRLLAALSLGVTEVPIDKQDYENEADEWADLVADNRLSELSNMNPTMLKELLDELRETKLDMDLTGFTDADLEKLVIEFGVPDQEFKEYDESIEKDVKKVVCPHCGEEFPV